MTATAPYGYLTPDLTPWFLQNLGELPGYEKGKLVTFSCVQDCRCQTQINKFGVKALPYKPLLFLGYFWYETVNRYPSSACPEDNGNELAVNLYFLYEEKIHWISGYFSDVSKSPTTRDNELLWYMDRLFTSP